MNTIEKTANCGRCGDVKVTYEVKRDRFDEIIGDPRTSGIVGVRGCQARENAEIPGSPTLPELEGCPFIG